MKYLENGVRLIKSSMSKYRSLWIIIAASIIVLGVFLLLIFKYFPQYSRLSVLAVLTIAAMSAFPVVPHELIILYLSNYYTPITVTLLTLAGSTFAEYLNYKLVSIFFKIPKLNAQKKRKLFKKAMHYFLKMPFVSVFVAAIAFIPFSPFRIIAPMSKYPVKKYITAIVFGRAPRFYLIAYFG
ncbi:MAG: VTT domain-containing protein, partial [bacterium]|nr:VTT domain-containing protein [bacterium]